MNKYIFSVYRVIVPKPIRTAILKKNLRKSILNYFSSMPANEINDEQKEVINFLSQNQLKIFPYPFDENYSADSIMVYNDAEKGMKYVLQDGKKLYFKKRWSENRIRRAYSDLSREQDINSPHRYLTSSFSVSADDVIADIGAAEGNFSLDVIDRAKKIYLFEYDREWSEALKVTFSQWPGKVEIINKYLSDVNDESHVRFDTFFREHPDITFLKIDVDGAESVVLKSCAEIFKANTPMKVALCTYHKNDDEKDFTALLKDYGFSVSPSRGYMIHFYDKKIKAPFLRRGLIRAIK